MEKPLLIVSPVGTSLLTNGSNNEERRLITANANCQQNEIAANDLQSLRQVVDRQRAALLAADTNQARRLSAELNSLLALYETRPPSKKDLHFLLRTDTWLGEMSSEIVKARLVRDYDGSVEVKNQTNLCANDLLKFKTAATNVVKWCEDMIAPCRESYHVVFNLTGGFKAVQGFMQTLAMFYADEAIYIFENSPKLLRIPRLPIRMDKEANVRDNLKVFRRFELDLPVSKADVAGLPNIYWEEADDLVLLSPWGELVWKQTRKDLYGEKVFPPPSDKVRLSESFLKSTQDLPPDRLRCINDRVDGAALYMESKMQSNLNSFDFYQIKGGTRGVSTHETDAWADKDAKRIYVHLEPDTLVFDDLAEKMR